MQRRALGHGPGLDNAAVHTSLHEQHDAVVQRLLTHAQRLASVEEA